MGVIKLIALDIGGSLINDDNVIPEENLKAIKKAKSKGIQIALITARMYSSTKYISCKINADYGVFSNGSIVMNLNNKVPYYDQYIPKQTLTKLIDFARDNKMYLHVNRLLWEFSDKKEYFTLKHMVLNENYPDELKSNVMVVDDLKSYCKNLKDVVKVLFVSEDNMDAFKDKFEKSFPKLYITEYYKNSNETAISKVINYIEVGTKPDTKAGGLKRLAKELGIKEDEILVIGDGKNDIELFKEFNNTGCLQNGIDEAKEYASYVSSKTNNEAGVAEIIDYFMERR